MKNQVCVVTGANSGVGFETARFLARLGAKVVMVCRDPERGRAAQALISSQEPSAEVRLEVTDLAGLGQVRALGKILSADFPQVHLLVNNAGSYGGKLERTEDGFERTFAVNHLSHFLLTHLLLPNLLAGSGRVLNVSSEAHRRADFSLDTLDEVVRGRARFSGWGAYCDSKLANVLFTRELAGRYRPDELTTCSLHPGVLATRLWNQDRNPLSRLMCLFKPFMGKASVGSDAIEFLSQEPGERIHGRYFNRKKEVNPSPLAQDSALARRLWKVSETLVEEGPER